MLLGKATRVISTPYLHGGSMLAFFIGSLLGLAFIKSIPSGFARKVAQFFSLDCSLVSFSMLCIFQSYSINARIDSMAGMLFFILLCLRFSLWFYSRVKRAEVSAGHHQSVAWVEFGYLFGMVNGLVFWDILNFPISLPLALAVDLAFQFCAGCIELYTFKQKTSVGPSERDDTRLQPALTSQTNAHLCNQLSRAIVLLTVGVQVTLFHLAHQVGAGMSTYLLATFYLEVSMAAFFCKHYDTQVSWNNNQYAQLSFKRATKIFHIPALLIFLTMALSMVLFC